jgi:hypothetical protein
MEKSQSVESLRRTLSATSKGERDLEKLLALTDPAQPILTILHFNDVYDIQSKQGSRGVCHFKAQL